jgi:murein DD-endopeptidase MepM/ murein hydrolase activator NlpD
MSMRRVLYIGLSAVVLVALVASAVLVFSYRPPGDSTAALPTPSPTTQTPTGSDIPGATTGPNATDPSSTEKPGTSQVPPSAQPVNPLAKDTLAESLDPEELTGYVWPVRRALITGRMTPREFGAFLIVDDGPPVHDGLDLATHCGDRVRAAHDGTVLYAGRNFDPYLGYRGDAEAIYARLERLGRTRDQPIVVVIDDGNGYRSVYVHLQEAQVEPGQVVLAGDVIGLEGQTGFATGCHLHYGLIRMDGPWQSLVPRLAEFGYPLPVRERINALRVLPWGDPFAPQRLQDRVNGTPSPGPITSPTTSATPDPSASLQPTPTPSALPSESASPTGSN